MLEVCRGALDLCVKSHLVGQDIGRAAGENRQVRTGVHHAFGCFIDGAVAAGDNHQIGAAPDVFARDCARGPRALGGGHRHVMAVFLKSFYGPPDERASAPSEPAGPRIVDQDGIPVGGYGIFSGFKVRL